MILLSPSGAIALGQNYLKIKNKNKTRNTIAAVGQIHLAGEFQKLFDKHKIKTDKFLLAQMTPSNEEEQ